MSNVKAHMTRLVALALLYFAAVGPAAAEVTSFSGAWAEPMCVQGDREKCGGIFLTLVQRGSHLCGEHFAATPGLGRLDEGEPKSVIGTLVGNTGVVSITTGRNGAEFLAHIRRVGSRLTWKVVELVRDGDGSGSLVPFSSSLVRDKSEDLQRVTSECLKVFDNAP
jgi:hypothetical protein